MTKNPFYNAVLAAGYIVLVVTIISSFEKSGPDTILIPIAMLSLFVLSAALTAYVFMFEPLRLFMAGAHAEAAALFLKTIGIFACITLVLLALTAVLSIGG